MRSSRRPRSKTVDGKNMTERTKLILTVGALGVLEALLRIIFYYEAVFAGVPLLQPMPPASTMNIVNPINLVLGIAGLLVIFGLLMMTRWGFWGTITVSLVTVVFDGASAALVSPTAFAGLILPLSFLVVLVPKRTQYSGEGQPK